MRKRNKQIVVRLSDREHELLKKTGYKPYEIIKMFLNKYYKTTPVGLAIRLDLLESKLAELQTQEIDIENEVVEIKNKLSNFNDLDLISDSTISLIKRTINSYLNKSISFKDISEFLEDNNDKNKRLVDELAYKSGYSSEDYKKLVIRYYDENYN